MADDDDDDDDDRDSRRSKSHRALTPTDLRTFAVAQAEAAATEDRSRRFRELELQLAELFGADGRGGEWATMKDTIAMHETKIQSLVLFKARILLIGSMLMTGGGVLAALSFKLIDYLVK